MDPWIEYLAWQKSGVGYWSNYGTYYVYNDFSFKVMRSTMRNERGYFVFEIHAASQSYMTFGVQGDAKWINTNVNGAQVWVGPNRSNLSLILYDDSDIGITFFNETTVGSFEYANPNPFVWIKWTGMRGT